MDQYMLGIIAVLIALGSALVMALYASYKCREKERIQKNALDYLTDSQIKSLFLHSYGIYYYEPLAEEILVNLPPKDKKTIDKFWDSIEIEVLNKKEKPNVIDSYDIVVEVGSFIVCYFSKVTVETLTSYNIATEEQLKYESEHPEVKRNRLLKEQNAMLSQKLNNLETQVSLNTACVTAAITLNTLSHWNCKH